MLRGYADLAFQFGLADENQAAYINSQTQTATEMIMNEKYIDAFQVRKTLNYSCIIVIIIVVVLLLLVLDF